MGTISLLQTSETYELMPEYTHYDLRGKRERPDTYWDMDDPKETARNIFYLNEYSTNLMWGGPEEGGWWYPEGIFIKCHAVTHEYDSALVILKKLMEKHIVIENEEKYEPTSVLCNGWHTIHIESHRVKITLQLYHITSRKRATR